MSYFFPLVAIILSLIVGIFRLVGDNEKRPGVSEIFGIFTCFCILAVFRIRIPLDPHQFASWVGILLRNAYPALVTSDIGPESRNLQRSVKFPR
jgi:hypothetical protein